MKARRNLQPKLLLQMMLLLSKLLLLGVGNLQGMEVIGVLVVVARTGTLGPVTMTGALVLEVVTLAGVLRVMLTLPPPPPRMQKDLRNQSGLIAVPGIVKRRSKTIR